MSPFLACTIVAACLGLDTERAYELRERTQLTLATLTEVQNGTERDFTDYIGMELEVETARDLSWTDRPLPERAFERVYDQAEGSVEVDVESERFGGESYAADARSPLHRSRVTFRPDEHEDGGWEATFSDEDREHDPGLLAHLRPDRTFGLAPPEEVAEGVLWRRDGEGLQALFAPGGDLHMGFRDAEHEAEAGLLFMVFLVNAAESAGKVEADLELTCRSVDDTTAGRLARIQVRGEAVLTRELTRRFREVGETVGVAEVWGEFFRDSYVRAELKLDGEYVWNLDDGCLEELTLESRGTYRLGVRISQRGSARGDVEYRIRFEGETRREVERR